MADLRHRLARLVHVAAARRPGYLLRLLDESAAEVDRQAADVQELEDLLGCIELYVNWRWITTQLTTPQKERWADAVAAWSARLNGNDDDARHVDRWWREPEESDHG